MPIRRFAFTFGVWLLLGCAHASPALAQGPQNVDELIARNLQAKGGMDRLQAISTVKQTSLLSAQGMQATVVVYAKRPNLLRQELTLGTERVVNAFDGTTSWTINTLAGVRTAVPLGGPQGDLVKDQSPFDGPLVNYKALGSTIEWVATEDLNGQRVQHLRLVSSTKRVQHYYLDAATGLDVRLVTELEKGTMQQDLSDFRLVGGVLFPFSIVTSLDGVPQSRMTVSSIELNVPVETASFGMPQ